ncbi:hypothetical protein PVAP13_6KG035135 [Panicum virgatum]|uniref:Uncharacterized protein n=1 Tax=Panicum virgatum TaxID=38727 RepID=A0A8T0R942_PANVG|nr:hypothetical protein PVAP13_6KG035135 [Panicum virgatum]
MWLLSRVPPEATPALSLPCVFPRPPRPRPPRPQPPLVGVLPLAEDSPASFFCCASHSARVRRSWPSAVAPPGAQRVRSSNALRQPTASSNAKVFKSKNYSMPAMTLMKRSGTVSNNFLTRAASLRVPPRFAYLTTMPVSLPAYWSRDSSSFMRRASKSLFNVCNRAALTRSAPTNLVLRHSHTSFAVFLFATCIKRSSWST